jgi:hypothetical protein
VINRSSFRHGMMIETVGQAYVARSTSNIVLVRFLGVTMTSGFQFRQRLLSNRLSHISKAIGLKTSLKDIDP